jgi:hypothetical protein
MHKLLLERDPIAGERLASQPTLSRFENSPRRTDLYRRTDALADLVRGKVRLVTVDMDPTDDPTVTGSKSTPSSWSAQRTRIERAGPNSYSCIMASRC